MYCRVCGSGIKDNAEICVKCGCRLLNGSDYCQECGARTSEKQEMCTRCGCMLRKSMVKPQNILESINNLANTTDYDEVKNLDFSSLPVYYQKEFRKIYNSNEQYKGKFNIWAFLFAAIWALTKGCWLSAIISLVLSCLTAGVGGVVYWFIFGFRGTYIYYCSYVKDKQCIL